jgi:hypothetical protein
MTYIPKTPEEERRIAAGKAGKLWRIVVRFTTDYSNETKLFYLTNQYGHEVMHFRFRVFEVGLKVPIDPGHWIVVPPLQIKEIHVYKQDNFFEP